MAALGGIFGGGGRKGRIQAILAAQEQEKARRLQQAALTNTADSEAARGAADSRLKKLAAQRGLAGTLRGGSGTAPVGYKMLMGN
jgi:hypothetical protein